MGKQARPYMQAFQTLLTINARNYFHLQIPSMPIKSKEVARINSPTITSKVNDRQESVSHSVAATLQVGWSWKLKLTSCFREESRFPKTLHWTLRDHCCEWERSRTSMKIHRGPALTSELFCVSSLTAQIGPQVCRAENVSPGQALCGALPETRLVHLQKPVPSEAYSGWAHLTALSNKTTAQASPGMLTHPLKALHSPHSD
jgi:hypothetical protein